MLENLWLNSDELFVGDRFKKKNTKDELTGTRCYKCIYAEEKTDLFEIPEGYIHCTYYPKIISKLDRGCKAGKAKEEGEKNETGRKSLEDNRN